jgi:hypothetical protein
MGFNSELKGLNKHFCFASILHYVAVLVVPTVHSVTGFC